ncbi:hypothetical protein LguiB_035294 [Lonicera macranthoides]
MAINKSFKSLTRPARNIMGLLFDVLNPIESKKARVDQKEAAAHVIVALSLLTRYGAMGSIRALSIEHRAVANETRTRISLASFVMPNMDVEIEPLQKMLNTQQNHKKYKILYGDYLNHALQQKLVGKEYIGKYKS